MPRRTKSEPETPDRPRYAGYVRVSVVGGRAGDSFISPSVQREQIEAWARLRGVDVVDHYEDLDQTGGKLSRPGLDALMDRVRRGEVDGVAVARLDRLSRAGVADALKLIEEMDEHGVKLAAVDLGLDPTTYVGEFATTIMLALARMERRRITEGWDVSNARAIARGVHFTAQVPFGYVRGEDKRLVPDPETAPLVREAFLRRARRDSWRAIADWLNGERPREDGRSWSPRFVATMIQRRTYLGLAHHGKHELADAHPAVVTLPEWDAANAVTGGPGPVHEAGSLLAGIIRCAGCRYAMRRTFTTYRDGRRVELYSCQVKHTGGKCPEPANVMAHVIEPAMEEWALLWVGHASREEGHANGHLEEAQRRYEDAEARLSAFLADYDLQEAVGRDAYLREAEKRREAVEEAADALEVARREHAAREHGRVRFLADEWESWDKGQRADALRRTFDSVYVKKGRAPIAERAFVRWAGEDDHDRPRRGTTNYRTTPIPWPENPVLASAPSWAADDPMEALAAIALVQALQSGEGDLAEQLGPGPPLTDAEAPGGLTV
jgi:site-specific DNA recombinase